MEAIIVDAAEWGVRLDQVMAAAGTSKADDETYRRFAVDVHDGGVRVAATNRSIVVASWVPVDARYDGGLRRAAPEWGTPFNETFVVDDSAGALASTARKLAGLDPGDDETIAPAVLSFGQITDNAAAGRGRRLFGAEGLVVTSDKLRALAPVEPGGQLGATVDWRLIMDPSHAEPWNGEMVIDRATAKILASVMRSSMRLTTGQIDGIPLGWARIDGVTTAVFVLQGGDAQISAPARKARAKADDDAAMFRSVLARLQFDEPEAAGGGYDPEADVDTNGEWVGDGEPGEGEPPEPF